MTVLRSLLYKSDVDKIVHSLKFIDFPVNKKILITGATGLICSAVVDVLFLLNKIYNFNWKIIVAVRNIKKAEIRFSDYLDSIGFSYMEYDASIPSDFPDKIDYIIHGAGNAYPLLYAEYPVETLLTSVGGLKSVLDYAKKNKTKVLYISSSEVYGQLQTSSSIKEDESGFVDILNSRAAYPMGKRVAETLCTCFAKEYFVDNVIVRPGHIYGPTASVQDNRISSIFMYDAAMGKNLVLKSDGSQIRSYCYCLDCASAIISVLFKGEIGQAYNVSNKNSICSIREMAEFFAKSANVRCVYENPTDVEKKIFNPMLNSSLNSEKLEALGWSAIFEKDEGFSHSVAIIREINHLLN